jgi:FixJ family two-component response regulator
VDFLAKPFDDDVFLAVVHQATTTRRPGRRRDSGRV